MNYTEVIQFNGKKLLAEFSSEAPKIGDKTHGSFMNAIYPMKCVDVSEHFADDGRMFYSAIFQKIDKNGNLLSDEYNETHHFIIR